MVAFADVEGIQVSTGMRIAPTVRLFSLLLHTYIHRHHSLFAADYVSQVPTIPPRR